MLDSYTPAVSSIDFSDLRPMTSDATADSIAEILSIGIQN